MHVPLQKHLRLHFSERSIVQAAGLSPEHSQPTPKQTIPSQNQMMTHIVTCYQISIAFDGVIFDGVICVSLELTSTDLMMGALLGRVARCF